MARGYKKGYELRAPVVTCWNCGALVFPRYRVAEGTGVGPGGERARKRPRKRTGKAIAHPQESPSPL